ncbi:MAG: sortase [Ilumatobacteraceae bacterium]
MRRLAAIVVAALSLLSVSTQQVRASSYAPTAKKLITVGKLSIPRLKIASTIYKGVTNTQFNRGVGFWPGTALPGEKGNLVIGGHRTAAQRPFYNIQKLKRGDIITVSRPGKSFRYKVTKVFVVRPTDVWIVNPTSSSSLTLFTCHPRGSTSKRYVVRATLVR